MTIKSIGYGKEYPDIATWWAAHPDFTSESWDGELYPFDSGGSLEYASASQITIADAGNVTYHGSLKPADGYGFKDHADALTNPLRYDATKGIAIRKTSGYAYVVSLSSDYFELSGVQITNSSDKTIILQNRRASVTAIDLIISGSCSTRAVQFETGAGLINSVIINEGNGNGVYTSIGASYLYNCTVFGLGGSGALGVKPRYSTSTILKNTAVFGFTRSVDAGTYGTCSNNAADDAYMPGTDNQDSKTASDQFENIASLGTLDLRAKSGDLDGNGVRDQTNTGDLDIAGQDRSTTEPTIGAWEVVGSGLLPINLTDIVSGTPVLGAPTIGQNHALSTPGITAGSPSLGVPSIGQSHVLAADNIVTLAPVLASPVLSQSHILGATNLVIGTPVLDSPAIGQTHNLIPSNITTGTPIVASPALDSEEVNDLEALSITTGLPILDSPTLGQTHNLTATGVTTEAPTLSTLALGQTHALTAIGFTTGIPVLGSPVLDQVIAGPISLSPGKSAPKQKYFEKFQIPLAFWGMDQTFNFTALGITAGAPVLDSLAIGQTHNLTVSDTVSGVPALGSPAIGQNHVLSASDTVSGVPVLDTPTIGQAHNLTATGITTGIPVLDSPQCIANLPNSVMAVSFTTGVPDLDSPVLGQIYNLTADDITVDIPTLDSPALGQDHKLTAIGITTGAPVVDISSFGQVHSFTAVGVTTGVPSIGSPALGQRGLFQANGITTGVPVLDSPALGQVHSFVVPEISTGIPVLEVPTFGQIHSFTAVGITTGVPVFGVPWLVQAPITPAERLYVIDNEDRYYTIESEERYYTIESESRI